MLESPMANSIALQPRELNWALHVPSSVFHPNTPSCEEMKASARIFKHNHLATKVKVAERDHGPQCHSTRAPLSPRVSTSTKVAAVPAHSTFVEL